MKRICVFCGAATGAHPAYEAAATSFGAELAGRGLGLVYGAGCIGLMGSVARAALAQGGAVVGVVPEALNRPELVHDSLTKLHVVPDLGERKARMHELSDAFVALPGGYGTFDELFDAAAPAQLGFHSKPVGLLNVRDYFAPLLAQIDRGVSEGFIAREQRRLLVVAEDPNPLLDALLR